MSHAWPLEGNSSSLRVLLRVESKPAPQSLFLRWLTYWALQYGLAAAGWPGQAKPVILSRGGMTDPQAVRTLAIDSATKNPRRRYLAIRPRCRNRSRCHCGTHDPCRCIILQAGASVSLIIERTRSDGVDVDDVSWQRYLKNGRD